MDRQKIFKHTYTHTHTYTYTHTHTHTFLSLSVPHKPFQVMGTRKGDNDLLRAR